MSTTPSGLAAINTYLERGSGVSPYSFAIVPNVGDIAGFDMSSIVLDTTSHSTGVPFVTRIAGIRDAGKLTFPLYYVAGSQAHQQLLDDWALGTIVPWREVWAQTGGLYWQCDGFISALKAMAPVKGLQTLQVEITFTGDPILPTSGGTLTP